MLNNNTQCKQIELRRFVIAGRRSVTWEEASASARFAGDLTSMTTSPFHWWRCPSVSHKPIFVTGAESCPVCAVRGCCLRRHDAEDRLVGNDAPDPLYNRRRRRPVYRTTHSARPMMTDDAIGRQPCTDRHTSTMWQRDVTTRIVTWVGWLVTRPITCPVDAPPPHNSHRFTRYQ